jgi:hypothetical protein
MHVLHYDQALVALSYELELEPTPAVFPALDRFSAGGSGAKE